MNNKKPFLFGMVGGVGFAVDVAAMALLSQVLPISVARAGSFWVAASSNWWLNRQLTFKEQQTKSKRKEWLKFLLSSCLGFIPNWGCYALLVRRLDSFAYYLNGIGAHPIFEVCLPYVLMIPGILLGMIINFNFADKWVFSRKVTE